MLHIQHAVLYQGHVLNNSLFLFYLNIKYGYSENLCDF